MRDNTSLTDDKKEGSSYTILNNFLNQIIKSKYNEIQLEKDVILADQKEYNMINNITISKKNLRNMEGRSDIQEYIFNCKKLIHLCPIDFYDNTFNSCSSNKFHKSLMRTKMIVERKIESETKAPSREPNESRLYQYLASKTLIEPLIKHLKKINNDLESQKAMQFFFKLKVKHAIKKMEENTASILKKQNEKKEMKILKEFGIKHQPRIDELFSKSISFFENKDYKNTMICLSKAIDIDPTQRLNKNLYIKRSEVKFELGDYYGCIKDLDSAINLKSNDLKDCYYRKGLANFKLKLYKEAINNFYNVIKLDPYNSESYYYTGLCKINLEDKENGCLDLSRAGELGYFEAYEQIKKHCNKDDRTFKQKSAL